MKLPQIETLLLQEMVEVKGGRAGVCKCTSGAGQGTSDDGECSCEKGAAQLISETPLPGGGETPSVCMCTSGSGFKGNG